MARITEITTGGAIPTPGPPLSALPAPTLNAAPISASQINLTAFYTPGPALATYHFQIAPTPAGPWTDLITQPSGQLAVSTGLQPNTPYWFQCNIQTSESPSRTSAWSNMATATTSTVAIPVPTPSLAASVISTTQINLAATYSGPPAAATYSFLYSSVSNVGPWTALATQAGSAFNATGLTPGTQYWFQCNIQTTEVPSRTSSNGTATATTQSSGLQLPGQVINLSYTSTLSSITTNWPTPTTGGAPATYTFVIDGGTPVTGITANSYTVSGLAANTAHSIVVTAVNSTGAGPASATLLASTQAITQSPSGTTIPTATQLIDAALNIWTIVGGVVQENGSAASFSSGVTTLLYYNGVIYQFNGTQWFPWTGTAWGAAQSDPRSGGGGGSGFGVKIVGNKFYLLTGEQFIPQGAAMGGLEGAAGIANSLSSYAAMTVAQWKAIAQKYFLNHFRVCVQDGYWLQNTNGFKATVTQIVNNMTAAGVVVLFDLHWGAPSTYNGGIGDGQPGYLAVSNHVAFWTDVANTFKNNLAVVFELLNEPFGDGTSNGIQYLKNGSGATQTNFYDQKGGKTVINTGAKMTVAGFQQITTAIRGTGALHAIVCGCPAFSSDINNSLNVLPSDPLSEVCCNIHYCNGGSNSPYQNILNAGIPVWITEYAKSDGTSSFHGNDANLGGQTWLNAHGVGHTIWSVSGSGWSMWGGPGPASWINIPPWQANNTDVFTGWPNGSPHP